MSTKSLLAATGLAAVCASLLVAATAGTVEANGRSPASVSVHLRTGSTTDLAVWTTWGILISRDGGGFRWMCEESLKVGGAFDPDIVFRADGSLVVTSFEGLLVNRDGCAFAPSGLGPKFVTSVAEGPDGALYAGVVERLDSKIYKSTDGGMTFPTSAEVGQLNDWWESLEVAPSDSDRVYLSGYRSDGQVKTHLMFRSDDSGDSFEALSIPQPVASLSSDLEIAAISPNDPDVVYVRVTYALGETLGDRFFRSIDAGMNWAPVLTVPDSVPGFVVRQDGEVLAASATSGTWRSPNGDPDTFTKQATSLQTRCMTQRSDGTLFACAQNFAPDNMSIGSSTDGTAWTKVFRFAEAEGPVDCAVDSLQCSVCQLTMWCGLREQFGIAADPTSCAEAGPDGTTCGGPLPPVDEPDDGGCCGTGGGPVSLVLGLFVAGALRRPRRAAP
jgi:uncharacterized protein (TIGR03382 family)